MEDKGLGRQKERDAKIHFFPSHGKRQKAFEPNTEGDDEDLRVCQHSGNK